MNAAFYALDDFPPLARLTTHCALIQHEVAALQAPLLDIDRTDKPHRQVHAELDQHLRQGGSYGWLKGWGAAGGNRDWTQYPLLFQDSPLAPALAALPQTLAQLQTLRGIKVASLARLAPHSFLSTHRHPEIRDEGLLQMHLTLSAASEGNYAYLNVAGQFHQHRPGSAVIFDGSLDHFVVNASEAPRIILYLEFNREQASR